MRTLVEGHKKKYNMDAYAAVFNCHIHNAKERAFESVSESFGATGLKEIQAADNDGIMSIFQTTPTPVTMLFAKQVQTFVNE